MKRHRLRVTVGQLLGFHAIGSVSLDAAAPTAAAATARARRGRNGRAVVRRFELLRRRREHSVVGACTAAALVSIGPLRTAVGSLRAGAALVRSLGGPLALLARLGTGRRLLAAALALGAGLGRGRGRGPCLLLL